MVITFSPCFPYCLPLLIPLSELLPSVMVITFSPCFPYCLPLLIPLSELLPSVMVFTFSSCFPYCLPLLIPLSELLPSVMVFTFSPWFPYCLPLLIPLSELLPSFLFYAPHKRSPLLTFRWRLAWPRSDDPLSTGSTSSSPSWSTPPCVASCSCCRQRVARRWVTHSPACSPLSCCSHCWLQTCPPRPNTQLCSVSDVISQLGADVQCL